MNPLSAWTFYRRHVRHVVTLLSLSTLITVGLYSLVALVWGVYVEPGRVAHLALSRFSLVTPQTTENGPGPAVLTQLESNPDIARIIPSTTIRVELPGMVPDQGLQFDLLGLMEKDTAYLLERLAATVMDGHLPQPGVAQLVLSEDVANILGVTVGDRYVATSAEFYAGMDLPLEPISFEVVGILNSDVELGMVSLEFLNHHRQYRQLPIRLLVVAQEGREAAVDSFLQSEVLSRKTEVMTHQMLSERILAEALPGLLMLLPVVLVVAIAFSLLIVVVNQLSNARRTPEFGILHATGHGKRWLVRRLTTETTAVVLVGWALGIGLSTILLHLLKVTVFAARGHDLSYVAWLPVMFSLPMPAMVATFTFLTTRRTLKRLDPVAVVERRELSQERNRESPGKTSSPKPLAPATFYRRHRRRAVLLVSAMSVMILAVVLIVFVLAVGADAKAPFLGYLNRVSLVRSPGIVQSLDPGVVARVKAHPAVERTIPVAPRYSMLNAYIPPFNSAEASPLGVYAGDMAYLVELYSLELQEGHLPRAGTNEMVISEALARNRGLEVGDVVGDPNRPAYPGAPPIPTEFVISGILRSSRQEDASGLGFVSLEFMENHPAHDIPDVPPLIVVPKAGQKDALDTWLENDLAGTDASVLTFRQQVARLQQKTRQDMLSMALLEGIVAVVAAVGLAVLNHVFNSQRSSEFGVLHALGYSRGKLVGRVFGETAATIGVAWGLSAIAALMGILFLRRVVFEPRGLTFGLFDPTPWLYTLPIPTVVLAVTTGTTAQTLRRLDPVAVVERKA